MLTVPVHGTSLTLSLSTMATASLAENMELTKALNSHRILPRHSLTARRVHSSRRRRRHAQDLSVLVHMVLNSLPLHSLMALLVPIALTSHLHLSRTVLGALTARHHRLISLMVPRALTPRAHHSATAVPRNLTSLLPLLTTVKALKAPATISLLRIMTRTLRSPISLPRLLARATAVLRGLISRRRRLVVVPRALTSRHRLSVSAQRDRTSHCHRSAVVLKALTSRLHPLAMDLKDSTYPRRHSAMGLKDRIARLRRLLTSVTVVPRSPTCPRRHSATDLPVLDSPRRRSKRPCTTSFRPSLYTRRMRRYRRCSRTTR